MRIITVNIALMLVATAFGAPAPQISLVSRSVANLVHATGDSLAAELSATGEWAAFTSSADALVPGLPRGFQQHLQVYLRNTRTGGVRLVSRTSSGGPARGDSIATGISADGRFVVFESDAGSLVPSDHNDASDIFLYDRDSDSLANITRAADGGSTGASITPDGRFIFFESEAGNLTAGDTNAAADLFRFDRVSGEIALITASLAGDGPAEAGASDFEASYSADGRWAAFLSTATNLSADFFVRTNAQLFLRDLATGSTRWISRQTGGSPESRISRPLLSGDGSTLAYIASARDHSDRFLRLHSISSGLTTTIWQPESADTNSVVERIALNRDGRFVAFSVFTANEVPVRRIEEERSIFIHDRQTETRQTVFTTSVVQGSAPEVEELCFSDDGAWLAFLSDRDSRGRSQLYSFHRPTGESFLLSRNSEGAVADRSIDSPVLSADGSTAVFATLAGNLAGSNDSRGSDLFFSPIDASQPPTPISLAHPSYQPSTPSSANAASILHPGPNAWSLTYRSFSADGRFLVFYSDATDLVPDDTNGLPDLFVADLVLGQIFCPIPSQPGASVDFIGLSADGNRLALAKRETDPGDGRSLQVFDIPSRSLEVTVPFLSSQGEPLYYPMGISEDGKNLFYGRGQRSLYKLALDDGSLTPALLSASNEWSGLSSGGSFLYGFRHSKLFHWPSQEVVTLPSPPISSSFDDEVFLLEDFYRSTAHPNRSLLLHFRSTGETRLVATNVNFPVLSADGAVVAFGLADQTLLYDTARKTLEPIRTAEGEDLELESLPSISADARFAAFAARRNSSGHAQVYRFDRLLTQLTLVSQTAAGAAAALPASAPMISADGRVVVFRSLSSDLAANDWNQSSDIFVARFPIQDSDSDGLEDGWEIQNFGSLTSTGASDTDLDGYTAAQEYLFGTDPSDASSHPPVLSLSRGASDLTLRFNAVPWRTYRIESAPGLTGPWLPTGNTTLALDPTIQIALPKPQAETFYRLALLP